MLFRQYELGRAKVRTLCKSQDLRDRVPALLQAGKDVAEVALLHGRSGVFQAYLYRYLSSTLPGNVLTASNVLTSFFQPSLLSQQTKRIRGKAQM